MRTLNVSKVNLSNHTMHGRKIQPLRSLGRIARLKATLSVKCMSKRYRYLPSDSLANTLIHNQVFFIQFLRSNFRLGNNITNAFGIGDQLFEKLCDWLMLNHGLQVSAVLGAQKKPKISNLNNTQLQVLVRLFFQHCSSVKRADLIFEFLQYLSEKLILNPNCQRLFQWRNIRSEIKLERPIDKLRKAASDGYEFGYIINFYADDYRKLKSTYQAGKLWSEKKCKAFIWQKWQDMQLFDDAGQVFSTANFPWMKILFNKQYLGHFQFLRCEGFVGLSEQHSQQNSDRWFCFSGFQKKYAELQYYVLKQLVYHGILYHVFSHCQQDQTDTKNLLWGDCAWLLQTMASAEESATFRAWMLDILLPTGVDWFYYYDEKIRQKYHDASKAIQRVWRGHILHDKFTALKRAVIRLQFLFRKRHAIMCAEDTFQVRLSISVGTKNTTLMSCIDVKDSPTSVLAPEILL